MKEIFFIILFLLSQQAISNEERWPLVIKCQGNYDSIFDNGALKLSCNESYKAELRITRNFIHREIELSLSSLYYFFGKKLSNNYNYNIIFLCNSSDVAGSYSGLEASSGMMGSLGLNVGGFINDDGNTFCILGGAYQNDNSLFTAGISTSLEIYK
jgi:hypothetical protein